MTEGLSALREGRAIIDLSAWRKVMVRGREASAWLNDLLTAELAGLEEGEARRSLLLSPTGRMRADVAVTQSADGFLLLQDPIQPSAVDRVLAPYVLSSNVVVEDRSGELGLVAMPDGPVPPAEGRLSFRPSPLGTGRGIAVHEEEKAAILGDPGLVPVSLADLEAFRIERGVPRFGVDLGEESLPHEAPMGDAIAHDKGCFLGQEAVAKVRNLGHPPFVLIAVDCSDRVEAGGAIMAEGREVGRITSAARLEERSAALARVRWAARGSELRTREGESLRRTETRSGWESAPA
jgi:folate-binding protein YgfZ